MTEVISINASEFKFSRGFQMPDDSNLEDTKLDIVKWGKNNLFPNFLNNIFYSSAYQSGIVRGKVNYIVGSGYQAQGEDLLNFGDYSLQDILDAVCLDVELYNAFALRCMRNVRGEKSYEHIDFDMLRLDKLGRGWWYSEDWSQSKQSEEHTKLRLIPNYDPNNEKQFDSIYVAYAEKPKNKQTKTSKQNQVHDYPQPQYIGALKSLMTDIEIQSFHLYNIINGMKVSGALNFSNGEPANKSQFEEAVRDAITPSENSGGVMITYSDGDDRKVAWVPFTGDDLDKRYLILEKSVVQNIMSAHSVTSPMLFGIRVEGQLGGTTEMEDSFNIFVRTYVRNRQKFMEEHLNYLFKGVSVIQMNEPEPLNVSTQDDNRTLANISGLSPIVGNKVLNSMTENEIRGLVELDPIEGGDVVKRGLETFKKYDEEEDEKKKAAKLENAIILELVKRGRSASEFKVLTERPINDEFDFEAEENNIKEGFFLGEFETSNLEAQVLDLLNKGNKLDEIIEALEADEENIKKAYSALTKRGLLQNGELTTEGIRELGRNLPEFETEVVYSYVLRPDVEGPAILPDGRTRDFCRTLLELNRVYTRAEIDQISALPDVDRNVWRYRGGWWRKDAETRPTPFCRHIWSQQLVTKRR